MAKGISAKRRAAAKCAENLMSAIKIVLLSSLQAVHSAINIVPASQTLNSDDMRKASKEVNIIITFHLVLQSIQAAAQQNTQKGNVNPNGGKKEKLFPMIVSLSA